MQVQVRHIVPVVGLLNVFFTGGQRPLMYPHRISKRTREQVVIALRHSREYVCKRQLLFVGQVRQRGYVSMIREHYKRRVGRRRSQSRSFLLTEEFERPNGPPRNERNEVFITHDDAALIFGDPQLKVNVVA